VTPQVHEGAMVVVLWGRLPGGHLDPFRLSPEPLYGNIFAGEKGDDGYAGPRAWLVADPLLPGILAGPVQALGSL
jgi:hypothetical protein